MKADQQLWQEMSEPTLAEQIGACRRIEKWLQLNRTYSNRLLSIIYVDNLVVCAVFVFHSLRSGEEPTQTTSNLLPDHTFFVFSEMLPFINIDSGPRKKNTVNVISF